MAWDPTAQPAVVVRELECSRDEHGVAQATITLRQWGTAERLKYEDDSAAAIELDTEDGVKLRRVRMSVVTLLHLRLTVVGSSGFPPGFDFANRADVESLAPDVFEEVVDLAVEVQPIPTGRTKRPADRKSAKPPAEATPETAADFDDEPGLDGLADPSPTPSTPGH